MHRTAIFFMIVVLVGFIGGCVQPSDIPSDCLELVRSCKTGVWEIATSGDTECSASGSANVTEYKINGNYSCKSGGACAIRCLGTGGESGGSSGGSGGGSAGCTANKCLDSSTIQWCQAGSYQSVSCGAVTCDSGYHPNGSCQYFTNADSPGFYCGCEMNSSGSGGSGTTVSPQVSVSPSVGYHSKGTVFAQPGSGFSPNAKVELVFIKPDGTTYTQSIFATTDSAGQFLNLYDSSSASQFGTYRFHGVDLVTGKQSPTVSYTLNP